jgi:hydrogenase maturation protein HypF
MRTAKPSPATTRLRWHIRGQVQGVGFRPFIMRLACQSRISGFVRNESSCVVIEAQGSETAVATFWDQVLASGPAAARIEQVERESLPCQADEIGFRIADSQADQNHRAVVTADLAVCKACLDEMRDSGDQRFGYGLINCANCGPRFSIIQRVPYDRANTTMSRFGLCEKCHQQYVDPADRRFHAQPVACPKCGPTVSLFEFESRRWEADRPIEKAAELLLAGGIVAIKGIGGFHLAVRADDEEAVKLLRSRKRRDAKPLALMCANLDVAKELVELSDQAIVELTSSAAPIILAKSKCPAYPFHHEATRQRSRTKSVSAVAAEVARGTDRLGVMLPYTPIQHLLFAQLNQQSTINTLVMTSANISDEPLVRDNDEAERRLAGLADAILWHDRDIERCVDDSILLDTGQDQAPLPIRRARGYVPQVIRLPLTGRTDRPSVAAAPGLCVGGELKCTVAVVRDDEVIVGQHLGNLKHVKGFEYFRKSIEDMCRLFEVKPQWIAHDMHPAYLSTQHAQTLAEQWNVPLIPVQHHHAHAAAVLAEHGVTEPALAVVCDGVGYGADGSIWGGELLEIRPGEDEDCKRLGHLRPILLPGGDAAARDTRRCAASLLWMATHPADGKTLAKDCEAFHQRLSLLFPDRFERDMLLAMLQSKAGCVASSAAGRVFDGVAALLGVCMQNDYEAQAPMALEAAASGIIPRLPVAGEQFVTRTADTLVIDLSLLVLELVRAMSHGHSPQQLAADFHEGFAQAWATVVRQAARQTGRRIVGLSGGVFCNALLTRRLTELLADSGLTVLRHKQVPPNDGGISFGQAAVARARLDGRHRQSETHAEDRVLRI